MTCFKNMSGHFDIKLLNFYLMTTILILARHGFWAGRKSIRKQWLMIKVNILIQGVFIWWF